MPSPERISGDLYRIYFSPRDGMGRSCVASLVIDLRDPLKVLDLVREPGLSPGVPGAFDDSGAMFSCVVRHAERRWLYYIGWTLGVRTPWRTAIGLAHSDLQADPVRFERHAAGPIVDRSPEDPFFVSTPFVFREDGRWRMWYLSGTAWAQTPAALPRYDIRHAQSDDGIHWTPSGVVCIAHEHPGEVAIARPWVIREDHIYKMFYSFRGDSFGYRIGYAESADGLVWTRRDHLIEFSGPLGEWETESAAYPAIFDHDGQRCMLYCGNGYSKGGFGLAVLAG
jgi:hypothetical protein